MALAREPEKRGSVYMLKRCEFFKVEGELLFAGGVLVTG
jgi:hypothetical protein